MIPPAHPNDVDATRPGWRTTEGGPSLAAPQVRIPVGAKKREVTGSTPVPTTGKPSVRDERSILGDEVSTRWLVAGTADPEPGDPSLFDVVVGLLLNEEVPVGIPDSEAIGDTMTFAHLRGLD